jgi:hypothetical protein
VYAEFLFYRGRPQEAAALFNIIDEKAPPTFRKVAPRKESAVTALLGRYSGIIESMKTKFFFIRSGA